MTKNKKIILFSIFVIFIILASTNSVSAAPGGMTYSVNGYVKTEMGAPISGAKVDLYLDSSYVGTVYTNYQGYYSHSVYYSGFPRNWKAVASKDGYTTGVKFGRVLLEGTTNLGTIYLLQVPSQEEKIAVFFWASDTHTQTYISAYKAILQGRGYSRFFEFKDSTNIAADFATVDAYEDADDTVFFFIAGHGEYISGHSYTDVRGVSGTTRIYSDQFRTYCDSLDSTKIGLLVESCHSYYWTLDMRNGGYISMAACDTLEVSKNYIVGGIIQYGYFANKFFEYVCYGYKIVPAYNVANAYILNTQSDQHPQIWDDSSVIFF